MMCTASFVMPGYARPLVSAPVSCKYSTKDGYVEAFDIHLLTCLCWSATASPCRLFDCIAWLHGVECVGVWVCGCDLIATHRIYW